MNRRSHGYPTRVGETPKLGDKLESALAAAGVTEESYSEFKDKVGLAPSCNCQKRKDWLNTVPAAFKSGGWKAAKEAAQAIKDKYAKPR